MINEISDILARFQSCFSRRAAFSWFVVIIFGLLVRLDQHGVTSLIRWLGLEPSLYLSCLNFFRASSWTLANLQLCWSKIVKEQFPMITIGDYLVVIGDGIKVSKEAKKMPAVKKLHQDSANSGKAEYIFGHHHGVLGILAGSAKKQFCVPMAAEIHEGMQKIREFQSIDDLESSGETVKVSIITSMATMACNLVKNLNKKCLLVLDAYFAAKPAFLTIKNLMDAEGKRLLHLIVKAKSNAVAYEEPEQKTKRRGRPRLYGTKVILAELFCSRHNDFQQVEVVTYGKKKYVSYLCLDLIWKPIKDKVRFVLVIDGSEKFILMCSDLLLDPALIITAYGYRFKIEVCLKMLKLLIGSFCYHFWSKAWPKRDRRGHVDMDSVTDAKGKANIVKAIKAIESFVNFGCIATGILQLLALKYEQIIWKGYRGWLRTYTSEVPSEETVMSVIQESFYHNFYDFSNTAIYAIISAKKRKAFTEQHRDAA
jgi:hypothetical protein